jgi:L-amino acid N-acyltransferase YncA
MTCAAQIETAARHLARCTPADQDALEKFYNDFEPKGAALGLPPRTPEAVHLWIESLRAYPGFVIREGDAIVGHALLCPEVYTGEVAVFVKAGHRGQGLGKRLLRAVIAAAADLDLCRVWGVCEPSNVAMLRLAHSCGFTPGKELGEFSLELSCLRPCPRPSFEPHASHT